MGNPIPKKILEFETVCRELNDTNKIHNYIESQIWEIENEVYYYFLKNGLSAVTQKQYLELKSYLMYLKGIKRPIKEPIGDKPSKDKKSKRSSKLIHWKQYVETYNHFTRIGGLEHNKAVKKTIALHHISEKTLQRAIKEIPS